MTVIDLALVRAHARQSAASKVIRRMPDWCCGGCSWTGPLAEGATVSTSVQIGTRPSEKIGSTRKACPRCGGFLKPKPASPAQSGEDYAR